jgi:hypothetical protein
LQACLVRLKPDGQTAYSVAFRCAPVCCPLHAARMRQASVTALQGWAEECQSGHTASPPSFSLLLSRFSAWMLFDASGWSARGPSLSRSTAHRDGGPSG